ncbi:hypothetical protein RABR111495_23340 [Rahnella bruchi]
MRSRNRELDDNLFRLVGSSAGMSGAGHLRMCSGKSTVMPAACWREEQNHFMESAFLSNFWFAIR